ncbi:DUF6850 family outer membrane beta-barrel protein [Chryseobacterium sp. G0186]|uniref:DUF6850 family outer membrane beta-barrel protein n=1 Tax=Chryseobacterium sp. G0186 TaxID=2487064 RepID=UPI000F512D57|nr:DUF6850 family outer membrane beta-barrel protein [Chryseobacterium sp. G0186]
MFNTKTSFFLLLVSMCFFSAKAQDSISLLKKIGNQYDTERDFKNNFFYNPASMSGYSSSSFSEFTVGYHSNDKKIYRQQLGNGDKGLTVEAKSFQKLKPNRYVWGQASYQNLKTGLVQWNESLDYDRVAPYITTDSAGGKLNIERYQFSGGYLQKWNRWTAAGEVSYLAQMGFRAKDPRLKSTTSDLRIKAGLNYNIFREYEIGVFGEFNKYSQNSSLTFQSLLGRPYVYQMTGFGFSNYLFNGSANPNTTFEEFSYKGGVQIANKQGKDFYLQAVWGKSNNIKSYVNSPSSNLFYDLSDLENKTIEVEGAKFLSINEKNRIGLLANFTSSVKTGSEYGYSLNTSSLTQIFKRKSYRKEDHITAVKGFYQYHQEKFSITATPFFAYEEIKERRLYPNSGQKFVYSYFGINADYKQQIKENQVLTVQPYFSKRIVNKTIYALTTVGNTAVDAWILEDYNFQASDITTLGASVRYDFKLEKLPAFFVGAQYQSQNIQKKNNNFICVRIGITF